MLLASALQNGGEILANLNVSLQLLFFCIRIHCVKTFYFLLLAHKNYFTFKDWKRVIHFIIFQKNMTVDKKFISTKSYLKKIVAKLW